MSEVTDIKCPGCGETVRVGDRHGVGHRIEKHDVPLDRVGALLEVPSTTWGGIDSPPTYRIVVRKRCEFSRAFVDVVGRLPG